MALQSERHVRKENNNKVKELEHALSEARTELQAEKLLLQQVTYFSNVLVHALDATKANCRSHKKYATSQAQMTT